LRAFEVKLSDRVRAEDLRGLRRFADDYPEARLHLLHAGKRRWHEQGVEVLPIAECLLELDRWL
jgi:hypothetical protein